MLPEKRILFIDDDKAQLQAFLRMLRATHYRCEVSNDPFTALQHPDLAEFDVILVDNRMPSMSGVVVLNALRARFPDKKLILVSGNLNQTPQPSPRLALTSLLDKPFSKVQLLQMLDALWL